MLQFRDNSGTLHNNPWLMRLNNLWLGIDGLLRDNIAGYGDMVDSTASFVDQYAEARMEVDTTLIDADKLVIDLRNATVTCLDEDDDVLHTYQLNATDVESAKKGLRDSMVFSMLQEVQKREEEHW